MRAAAKVLVRKKNLQSRRKPTDAPKICGSGPHFNALKHGLCSGHVLLPGDNVAEFRKFRQRLFHLHQPRTVSEAMCVETLAVSDWRIARARLEQRYFKHHLGAAMSGHPDATGYLCEPDLHRLHHRGTDSEREEQRLQKSKTEALTSLALLQRQRTLNLIPGAAALEDYTVFLQEGEPVVEHEELTEPGVADAGTTAATEDSDAPSANSMVGRASLPDQMTPATTSADGGNPKNLKRRAAAQGMRFPVHWSRRQRRAALRRMGKVAGQRRAG
jgi:hypothetical protein